MTQRFSPRLDFLPAAQRELWPRLRPLARLGFALYGGTAIALRLGHRTSVDFDFFVSDPLPKAALATAAPFVSTATRLQETADTLTLLVPAGPEAVVKVSLFGEIGFGRVGEPECSEDGVVVAAALEDLLATKLKTLFDRAEARDYLDIAALLDAGVSLARGLAAAELLFGRAFQPAVALKALGYFIDGDLPSLPAATRRSLTEARDRITDLPGLTLASRVLGLPEGCDR